MSYFGDKYMISMQPDGLLRAKRRCSVREASEPTTTGMSRARQHCKCRVPLLRAVPRGGRRRLQRCCGAGRYEQ